MNDLRVEVVDSGSALELTIHGPATVAVANALQERLMEALLGADKDVVVNVDTVEKLDGAGLQLLFAIKASVERRGSSFALVASEGAALRAIQLAGADALLGGGVP